MSLNRYTEIEDAVSDAITRLGSGATLAERSSVRAAVLYLHDAQGGTITRQQNTAIVVAAMTTRERLGK